MVRSFLGLCNFFRTHIKSFHILSQPLNKLLCKNAEWKGGTFPPIALLAFNKLREALCSDPIVAYPQADHLYALIIDASTGTASTPGGMGFILAQTDEQNKFHVISYGSRQLTDAEKNYSPFLLEMQAAVEGMKHYDNYLRGRKFVRTYTLAPRKTRPLFYQRRFVL